MARVLENYTLYSSEYFGHTFCKKTLSLPQNSDIVSVHENVRNGMPCAGLAISVLEDKEIKEFKKYNFLIVPIGTSTTVCINLNNYTLVGAANLRTSYYNVYYRIVEEKNCCDD